MKRLMIVDALNQFLRSYIVDPSLSKDGQPIGGSKGFMKILNKLTRNIKPDMIVVVWDGEGGSQKRRAVNKGYKAGRKPLRLNRDIRHLTEAEEAENKTWQQIRVMEYLNQTPVVQFIEPRVEADDVISLVCNHSVYKDWQKVIVSSDKDFIQLLDNNVILYRPTQDEILNTNKVVDKFGIHPRNFALARAMAGDKSDNLDGITGVGLGTIAKRFPFMAEDRECYLDELLAFCEEQRKENNLKVYTRIIEGEEVIRQNYKIMQLYSPSISIQSKMRIDETLLNYSPEFNKTALRAMMHKDGFGEVSLSDLVEKLNHMVSIF